MAPPKTVALICGCPPSRRRRLDLVGIWRELEAILPGLEVRTIPHLCRRGDAIAVVAKEGGAERLVLGFWRCPYVLGEIQTQARKVGVDPLGMELVDLETATAAIEPDSEAGEKAKLLLAAAVARAQAFAGSGPEHAKPYLSARFSRRSLFKLGLPEYRATPAIDASRCVSDIGCRACIDICPKGALQWADGTVSYDKNMCEPCGLCITACPRGAVDNPAITAAQLEAQIRTLLDPAIGNIAPRGIVYTCQRNPEPSAAYPAGWMPVALPCVAMAPVSWFLAPLLLGAGAVRVLPCGNECATGRNEVVAERVDYCQEFLKAIGVPTDRIGMGTALDKPPDNGGHGIPIETPFDQTASARVLLELAEEHGEQEGFLLDHAQSPLGLVEIREQACTGCTMCATACPTGALQSEENDDSVSLSFHTGLCSACGQCTPRCPEAAQNAIRLVRRTDLWRVRGGRVTVYREKMNRCVACGAAVAPAKMLERITSLLGEQYADPMPVITRYCQECRKTAGSPC